MTGNKDVLPRSETETLVLALVIAVALHAVAITQVGFDWFDDIGESRAPNLDVILVEWSSEQAPDEADFLAQANQMGGGDNTERERPSSPPSIESAGIESEQQADAEVLPEPLPMPASPILATEGDQVEIPEPDPAEDETAPAPDVSDLLRQTREIAQAAPDPLAVERSVPKRPRRKFITANTREHLYASYMRAWVSKVERVGNMNYPEEARRRKLEGSLVLSVDVLPDGSIEHIQILRSSGFEMLDEAAVRIVRLGAPYAELPAEIRAETDILVITRTWQFSSRGLTQ